MQLNEKISYLRKLRNMTQTELAENLDVSRQSVQKWESGVTCPDINKLTDLSKLLGTTTDILLDQNINETELLNKVMNPSNQNANNEVKKEKYSPLSIILFPVFALVFYLMVFMYYFTFGILVGILFGGTVALAINTIFSLVYMFLNLSGAGFILICISISIGSLGLIYPFYLLSRLTLKYYLKYAKIIFSKVKNIKIKEYLK